MNKAVLSCIVVCLFMGLPAAIPGSRTGTQEAPIKIAPELDKVLPAIDGGQPPSFTIETEPRALVSIMVATDFGQLITEKGQSIAKVFVTFFGSDTAGIPGTVLKADEEGRLTYTLPAPVFEAMSEGPSRIYYVAEVIETREGGHYDVLGVSYDYQNGTEENAPRILIDKSPRLAKAREHFESGQASYRDGDYEAAVAEFKAAQAIAPHPDIEYNVGICYLKLSLKALNNAVDARRFSAKDEARIAQFAATAEDFIKPQK